jgi:hypothetical protein
MITRVKFVTILLSAILCFSAGASAATYNLISNGQLDSAWQVSQNNSTGLSYTANGTTLSVNGIGTINDSIASEVLLSQNFLASGDFNIQAGFSWNSGGLLSAIQTLSVRAKNGNTIVTEAGYNDWWMGAYGAKEARVAYPAYYYDSGASTLPSSGSAVVTLKRTNGLVSILWNNNVILTGQTNTSVDKLELCFTQLDAVGQTWGNISVDYVTAVPEPATLIIFGIGSLKLLLKRKHNV